MSFRGKDKTACRQRGGTVLEFMAFVGLAAVTIAAATSLYKITSVNTTANQLHNIANQIVSNLRASLASGATGSTLTASILKASGSFSGWSDWATNGTKASTSKGSVTIFVWGANGFVTIAAYTGDSSVCNNLLNKTPPGDGKIEGSNCNDPNGPWVQWNLIKYQ